MILCSYTLDLTCDSARHHPFEAPSTAQYTARTRALCVEQARGDGWWLWHGKATCPRCHTPSTKPPKISTAKQADALALRMLRAYQTPMTAAELARLCNLSESTMCGVVKRLEAEGKIRRRRKTRTSSYLEVAS